MRIEHIAIWSPDIDRLRSFYERYFDAVSNDKYTNPEKGFSSYFLTFDSGACLEIMNREDIPDREEQQEVTGLAHFAVSTGSKKKVDSLTKLLVGDGFTLVDRPRTTGDGYYESVILDPDGNRVEITI